MAKRKSLKLLIFVLIAVAAAAAAAACYQLFASPTRVAFANYPEYMLSSMLDDEIPSSIKVEAVAWNDKVDARELEKYDMVIFFGMGLNFTPEQQEIVDHLKTPVYTTASTKRETALDGLSPEDKQNIVGYLNGGDRKNFRNLLLYIRRHVDGKLFFAPEPEPPSQVKRYAFFHSDEDAKFDTFEEYMQWYASSGRLHEGAPTVCIFSGNGGGDLEALVDALERRNLNVVGMNGMAGGLAKLEAMNPSLIIYQPHGRLSMGNPDATLEMLKKLNIPLMCPIKASQEYEVYLHDQKGMTGGMLSQSVTMPELDGGTTPFVLSALYRDERGLLAFKAIPDRLERFAELVRKTAALKNIPNSEKKLAIIYYGGIGETASVSGLGVGDSIYNLLKYLQAEGYNTGTLPESAEELKKEVDAAAAAFGTNAGLDAAKDEEGIPRLHFVTITPQEYSEWIAKSMPEDLYKEVTDRYGEFPGRSFRTEEGNLRIGCIRFGNIIFMPQSLPGEGASEDKLIHGVKMAPPHTFIATYLYIRHGFNADALMHFGTHGSFEFMPWKQVALSSYDWPDILIGEMPHYYLYIINNVGESQIAKRRSYATMVSHLTPPFMQADGYGALTQLHEKLESCEAAENEMLKSEYIKTIVEISLREHFDVDLKLSEEFAKGSPTDDDLLRLHNYIHEIQDAKVNRGLYVLGRPYSEEEADETARLMSVDAIADARFKADVGAGKVAEAKRKDLSFYTRNYLEPAHEIAREALAHPEKYRLAAAVDAPQPKTESTTAPQAMPERGNGNMSATPDEMKKMMETGKLPDGRDIPPEMMMAMRQMMGGADNAPQPPERNAGRMGGAPAAPVKPELTPEQTVLKAKENLMSSTGAELASIVNAFNGGYLYPSPGGDPVLNPDTVPTGKNLYGIDPERTPTKESFAVGKQLAEELIEAKLKSTGKYPKKVGFSLWGGEFIRTHGTNIGEIFYLLGVEPIWDSRGRVQDVRLIPMKELNRPRIDVVVQTSGQFRGAATSRMQLIDKAVALAANATDDDNMDNYVKQGSLEIVKALLASGMSPDEANTYANARLFGGVNGNFGTGITGMAQRSGSWDDVGDVAEVYLNNVGALYTADHWGEHTEGVFRAALKNTDTVVQSRSSNSWGPLSLDHVYEFTGGLSLAARHVNGEDPDAYFNDLRTPGRAKIQEAGEAVMVEARSTVLNPKYITEMMNEGGATTGHFAEVFHNTFGWEVMKPEVVKDHLWQEYKEVYVDDKLNLGVEEYFEKFNPSALHDMTAVMLESVRKGYWDADPETVNDIANRHAELMKKFDLPPVNNEKLRDMIAEHITDPELREAYKEQIQKALEEARRLQAERERLDEVTGKTLKEESLTNDPLKGDSAKAMIILAGLIVVAAAIMIIGSRKKAA